MENSSIQTSSIIPTPVFFLHGLKSSPNGTKATLIKKIIPNAIVPNLPEDIDARLNLVAQLVKEPSILIGSSLGGLTAIMYAMQYPGNVFGLCLFSPLAGFHQPSQYPEALVELLKQLFIPPGINTIIVAAKKDEIIPLRAIKDMIDRSPEKEIIQFIETNDEHSLSYSMDIVEDTVRTIISE